MRQWSVDASSEDAFSPFSPASQRSTHHSLRSLPPNVSRPATGGKPSTVSPIAASFPSAPGDWRGVRAARQRSGMDKALSRSAPSDGEDGRRCPLWHEAQNEEEEILFGAEKSRLLPPSDHDEDCVLMAGEEGSPGSVRLSRHIPQREGMNMSVSSFNLLESASLSGSASPPFSQPQQQPPQSQLPQQQHQQQSSVMSSLLMASRMSRARTAASVSPSQQAQLTGFGNTAGALPTPSVSTTTSFTESQVSDDSSYMTSLYNDMLAEKLIRGGDGGGGNATATLGRTAGRMNRAGGDTVGDRLRPRPSDGDSSSGRSSGEALRPPHGRSHGPGLLGGDVLHFGGDAVAGCLSGEAGVTDASSADRRQGTSASSPGSMTRTAGAGAGGGSGGGGSASLLSTHVSAQRRGGGGGDGDIAGSGGRGGHHARVLCTNPERVLDAPEFPANNSAHLIDWGSNNKLIIGLKSSLYAWDGETGKACKMLDLQGGLQIDCVQWLHKCACVALSVGGGTAAIYDCRSDDFIRTVRLPTGCAITGIAVNGPIMAISSDGPTGLTQAFDLRAKNALIATYEGHSGAVTAMQYCPAEPYYLATGGDDGHVRVWDSRRSQTLRYAYDTVHQGAVTALHWNPDRRSRLFTGGHDGVLCLIDTHASARTMGGGSDGETHTPLFWGLESGHRGGADVNGNGTAGRTSQHYLSRAVKSGFPISGMAVHNGEVVTAHRGQGQLQLRKASSFHLLGVFSSPNCNQSLSCLTLSPDHQVVCAAQEDETLKFWRVFAPSPSTATGGGDRGVTSPSRAGRTQRVDSVAGRLLTRHYRDPVSRLDDQLR